MNSNVAMNKDTVKQIVDHWFSSLLGDDRIFIDDVTNVIYRFYRVLDLRFSSKYKSKVGWKLFDDNTRVKRIAVKNDHYSKTKWILADISKQLHIHYYECKFDQNIHESIFS